MATEPGDISDNAMSIKYIALDGIDGCGKSTQIQMLCEYLRRQNYTPIHLVEPTYGKYGENIRSRMASPDPFTVNEQILLFTKDRHEHIRYKVRPLLDLLNSLGEACGFILVQDRTLYSVPAYQADDNWSALRLLAEQKALFPVPDIVFFLDTSIDSALKRISSRGGYRDCFEEPVFLSSVRERFLYLSEQEPNILRIDGEQSVNEVHGRIVSQLSLLPFSP